MKVQSLGHVVLNVGNRARSETFYNEILGLPIVARLDKYQMTFFSFGKHHDLAIAAVGEDAVGPDKKAVGLQHVAFKVGDDIDALKQAKRDLEAAGVSVRPVDHGVTKSLYFTDPDGNGLEVYIDASDEWRRDPASIAQTGPLAI